MHIFSIGNIKARQRRLINGLIGVPIMNISENIPKKNGNKKMKRFLLDKIGGQEIGISAKNMQIKTTAKKFFLFFCSSLLIAIGTLSPMAISVSADVPIITKVKTMAELILTLTAGAGTVITQPTVVNPIITEFGSADFQMQSLVDSGAFNLYDKTTGQQLNITTEEAIDHIGDPEWLDLNNAEFKMNYQNFNTKVSAANTLAKNGANLIHQAALQTGNPFDWDWGELIQTYLNQGKLSYELLFTDYTTGNTIIEDMAGILDNIISFWTPNIETGTPIDAEIDPTLLPLDGDFAQYTRANGSVTKYYLDPNVLAVTYHGASNSRNFNFINLSSGVKQIYYKNVSVNGSESALTQRATGGGIGDAYKTNYTGSTSWKGFKELQDESAYNDLINQIKNGSYVEGEKYSPDLVNPLLGNISPEDLQTLSPSIETGQAIIPFDQSAYKDLVDDVNDNTNNNVPEDNPALVYPFIQDYIIDNNQSDPNPSDPERPVNPSQPSIPDKEPITDEEMQENLNGATVGLEEIFPFCIPFDIVKLIKGLRAERQAPVIDWTFESDMFGFSYTFHIDLSEFNDVAAILRTMELIVFIIGLAVATRKLIGAGG